MMRKYMAGYEDGHGYGKFTFYSEHRAESQGNIDDACAQARKLYGAKRESQIDILFTELIG